VLTAIPAALKRSGHSGDEDAERRVLELRDPDRPARRQGVSGRERPPAGEFARSDASPPSSRLGFSRTRADEAVAAARQPLGHPGPSVEALVREALKSGIVVRQSASRSEFIGAFTCPTTSGSTRPPSRGPRPPGAKASSPPAPSKVSPPSSPPACSATRRSPKTSSRFVPAASTSSSVRNNEDSSTTSASHPGPS